MAGFTESLTVRIRGDSQELTDELERVQDRLREIASSFSNLGNADQGLSRLSARIAGMTGPLQSVSQLVQQLITQVQLLSNVAVTINVAPAIQALAQLSGMIASVAAQLQALSALSFVGGFSGGGLPISGGPRIPLPGFDAGGFVQGRTGVDRIPALLSHGEFVIRSSAVDRLGVAFLEQLNRGELRNNKSVVPSVFHQQPQLSMSGPQIGEVHVHVQTTGDVSQMLSEFELSQRRLRQLRG
jgi:hypothetical protein